MNIALFSDSYLPTKSGVVTVVVQLKNILEKLGHKVVVVTVQANEDELMEDDIFRVKSLVSPVGDGQYIGFPSKRKIVDFLRKNDIQIIHAHTEFFVGESAIRIGRKLNIPVIATTHTMWEDYYKHYFSIGKLIPKSMIRNIVKKLYKRFYALINVSQKAHDYFNQEFMLPNIPSAIIPNAIDFDKFSNQEVNESDIQNLRQSLGISQNDKVILYVGRIVEEKRMDELLIVMNNIVKRRDDVKVLFVGSGARFEKLTTLVESENFSDKIKFTGFVDWRKLPLYYSLGHVFVTVSLSEMHSMTILEALSMKVPVVCRYDTSFSDTVFEGENGYFGNTDEEVSEKINKILDLIDDDKVAYQKMKEKAFEVSQRFSLLIHGKRNLAFYEEILKHYPNSISSQDLKDAVCVI